MLPVVIILLIFVAILLAIGYRSVRIVPHRMTDVVERFGGYHRTLKSGFNIVIPFVDQIRERIDLRVQVVSFPPQAAITQDNLSVNVDTAVYVQVTDPYNATYQVANFIQAVEQLAAATLRNVIGGMDLEQTLTSREEINTELRSVLDEATASWGIEVSRVELKGVEPPESVQEAMEKQMRADRDKRAQILSAEGEKQSAILRAEGEQSSAVLSAKGQAESVTVRAKADAEAMTLRARGEADAIAMVFKALHSGKVNQELLAYQYLQKLPEIAQGDANKVWIVPSEMGKALEGIGGVFEKLKGEAADTGSTNDGPSASPQER
ncbi:regulator of protease activity HflC (stomatin/prohibitin superfamily) [Lipingzhangella halophila]|uniref:Regulator of protease activity HflC (Stomatin/prohibitin superfamily) n=1 Tax=Lipingzhangella halophila TaxID=1783352 RepID=A0A7W7RMF6_9ACTN|nr:SPFH domain-containing protein [Lipingzhangella halophila]MBB4934675.1 regulator of protease activity HflC (stomatin/prohibitin superfamily) [Lipingzhangella halophila]